MKPHRLQSISDLTACKQGTGSSRCITWHRTLCKLSLFLAQGDSTCEIAHQALVQRLVSTSLPQSSHGFFRSGCLQPGLDGVQRVQDCIQHVRLVSEAHNTRPTERLAERGGPSFTTVLSNLLQSRMRHTFLHTILCLHFSCSPASTRAPAVPPAAMFPNASRHCGTPNRLALLSDA